MNAQTKNGRKVNVKDNEICCHHCAYCDVQHDGYGYCQKLHDEFEDKLMVAYHSYCELFEKGE